MTEKTTASAADLHGWCRKTTKGFLTFENRELAAWPSDAARDLGIVEWTLRCLGNPANADVLPVLAALVERHGMRVTR